MNEPALDNATLFAPQTSIMLLLYVLSPFNKYFNILRQAPSTPVIQISQVPSQGPKFRYGTFMGDPKIS